MTRNFQAPYSLPPGATEMVLVRHAASAAHVPGTPFGLVGGHNDPPLAVHGHDQALALAARLGTEAVAALFVTPLQRTAQTAAPLAARLGLAPVVVPELREVHLGIWESDGGLSRSGPDRDPLRRRVLAEESWSLIPGGEDMEVLAARVRTGLEQVARATGPDRVGVAVVHGGVIAETCRQVTGSRPFAFFATENCSITRVVRTSDGHWTLQAFNDTAHLRAPVPRA